MRGVQVDVATCVQKYKLREGQLVRLQENAGAFAAKVVAFCDRMGYAGLRAVLLLFQVGAAGTARQYALLTRAKDLLSRCRGTNWHGSFTKTSCLFDTS